MRRPTSCRSFGGRLAAGALAAALAAAGGAAPAGATESTAASTDPAAAAPPPPAALRTVTTPADGRPVLSEREQTAILDVVGEPVDAGAYRLGPGDRLALSVPGVLPEPLALYVDAEGGLTLPGAAGRIEVGGLSLSAGRTRAARALEREYRERAFALVLVRPRRFKVHVAGEVAEPGTYLASATTRAGEIIERAGGVAPGGSERRIRIRRHDGTELAADLVAYALHARRDRNPYLEGGDLVQVPAAVEFVDVVGGVAHPGRYELGPGETLADLPTLAGGLLPGARPEAAEWRRLGPAGLGPPRPIDLGGETARTTPLAHGDAVVVPRDRLASGGAAGYVQVLGEVRFPGAYPIQPGEDTVGGLVERAGGWTDWASRTSVQLLRELPHAAATGGGGEEEADAAITFGSRLAFEREALRLDERQRPLAIATGAPHATLAAGDWLTLEDGDLLYVPRLTGRVAVDGRVRRPGLVPWSAERRARDYIELAGGFAAAAHTRRVMLRRAGHPTGELERLELDARVADGDLIWVPEHDPQSAWQTTQDIVRFMAQIATIVLIVDSVAKQ